MVIVSEDSDAPTEKHWRSFLSRPDDLLRNPDAILKREGTSMVAVKHIDAGGKRFQAAVKRQLAGTGFRGFFRSLRKGRACRSFNTARRLMKLGVPVAPPLAAVYKRPWMRTREDMYFAELLENGCDLYTFLAHSAAGRAPGVKRELSRQMSTIMAKLAGNGLCHRDSKASNFVVCFAREKDVKVVMVDMDGIGKCRWLRREQKRRTLWRLAASLMSIEHISAFDYLRGFVSYCNLAGIGRADRPLLLRRVVERARSKHLRTGAKTAAAAE